MKAVVNFFSAGKLRAIIRGKAEPPAPVAFPLLPGEERLGGCSTECKGPSVGVFVAEDALRVARMDGTGGARRLRNFQAYRYPGDLTPADEPFPAFLKTSLQQFGVTGACRIWAVIPSDRMEVYPLRIPRVAGVDLSRAAYWVMQKEKKFNEQEVIFDYSLLGEVMDKGIPKLLVICYLARRSAVEAVQRLYRRAGFVLAGVSFEAAAINNLWRADLAAANAGSWAHVHLDRDWSRIDLFYRNNFLFNRNIRTGSNSLVQAMVEESSTELAVEEAMALFEARLAGGGEAADGGSAEDPLQLITPALNRLANQTERTFEYFVQTLHFSRVEKLILSGRAALFPGLAEYLREQLTITVEVMDPFVGFAMNGGAIQAPAAPAERILYAVPLGLALAEAGSTPNFLHTYKEKERDRRDSLLSRAAVAGMALLIGLALAFYGWQANVRAGYRAELDLRQAELAAFAPELNPQSLSTLFAEVRKNRQGLASSLVRHKLVAVLGEISATAVASNIRLHSIMIDAGDQGATGAGTLILDGFVSGNRQLSDSYLAGYIVRLQASGLFSNVRLQKTSEELYPGVGSVLRFTLSVQYS